MRRILLISWLCFTGLIFFCSASSASTVILPGKSNTSISRNSFPFNTQDIEKILGRKLTLKEKIEFKIFKAIAPRKLLKLSAQKKDTDKAQIALILGIVGLAALVVPYVGLLSLPCAIVALVLGYSARREDPSSKKARTAITLGWITIGLFILAVIVVIAVVAAFAWY